VSAGLQGSVLVSRSLCWSPVVILGLHGSLLGLHGSLLGLHSCLVFQLDSGSCDITCIFEQLSDKAQCLSAVHLRDC